MKLIGKYKQLFSSEKVNTIVLAASFVLLSFWFTVMPEIFQYGIGGTFWSYYAARMLVMLAGYAVMFMLYLFLTVVVRKLAVSTFILGAICFAGGYTNYYKIFYRDEPIMPSDIFQIIDAFKVIGTHLSVPLTAPMYINAILIIVVSALLWFVRLPHFMLTGKTVRKLLKNIAAVVLTVALLVSAFSFWIDNDNVMAAMGYQYDEKAVTTYELNGFFPSFFVMMQDMFPSKPDDYSAERLAAIGAEIQAGKSPAQQQPDVITVVVESWFELSNYDATFSNAAGEQIDILENYHRLAAEGISGNIVSPKYGGGTSDVEYELLTGFSINQMTSANAFTVGLYSEFPNIVNYLRAQGYGTYSVHSYTNTFYNRVNAYSYLGFDQSYFIDDFDNPKMSGPWVSEDACIDKVIEVYEQSVRENDHVMIHALTMQNHMPMENDRYNGNEPVRVHSSQTGEIYRKVLPIAASSQYEVDQAIGRLADYLRTVDRDVILIVLGDHQTPLIGNDESDVLTEMGFFESYNESRDFLKLHTTPYLVWTKTGTTHAGQTFGNLPPNMLLPNALAAYNAARPAYFDYFLRKSTTMNGMSSNFVVNADNSVAFEKTAAQQSEADIRLLIQYDVVNGKKYILEDLY